MQKTSFIFKRNAKNHKLVGGKPIHFLKDSWTTSVQNMRRMIDGCKQCTLVLLCVSK